MKTGFVALALTSLLLYSCVDHNIVQSSSGCLSNDEISYSSQVRPIVVSNCTLSTCHDGTMGAELDWRDAAAFQAKAASVKDRITRPLGVEGHMPKNNTLSPSQIQTIVCWVDQGAQKN